MDTASCWRCWRALGAALFANYKISPKVIRIKYYGSKFVEKFIMINIEIFTV